MDDTFSANGVVVDQLTDQGAGLEFRNLDSELAASCLLSVVGSFGVVLLSSIILEDVPSQQFAQGLAFIVGFFGVLACLIGFWNKASDNRRISTKSNGLPPHNHVGGLGAAVFVLVVTFVFVAAYAGQQLKGRIVIPEWMGIGVVGLFAFGFAWVFFFSRLVDLGSARSFRSILEKAFSPLVPLGKLLSSFDSWLVFVVAPAVGVTLQSVVLRYFVMLTHIASGCVFAWFAEAPFGLVGAIWAFVAVIALTRRWSWVETERNRVIQDPTLKSWQLRIGLEEDLRDEAISSLLLLVLILPIAMRQFQLMELETPVFKVSQGSVNRLDAWVGFFGVELLKALPFLDWADIYNAEASTRIHTSTPLSMHVLLIARAIIDLVFIGAIIQAASISVSLAKNRSDFLSKRSGVDVLDQRIEQRQLERLAFKINGSWNYHEEIEHYLHYNPLRLGRLLARAKKLRLGKESRLYAAVKEITRRSGLEIVPPAELLPQVTASKKIDPDELRGVLDEIEELRQFDLEFLAIARRQMNWKSGLESERKRLVQMIVNNVEVTSAREQELAAILVGGASDSLANIRVLVVRSLARNVRANPQNLVSLSHAYHRDRSDIVKSTVASELKRLNITPLPDLPDEKRKAA